MGGSVIGLRFLVHISGREEGYSRACGGNHHYKTILVYTLSSTFVFVGLLACVEERKHLAGVFFCIMDTITVPLYFNTLLASALKSELSPLFLHHLHPNPLDSPARNLYSCSRKETEDIIKVIFLQDVFDRRCF